MLTVKVLWEVAGSQTVTDSVMDLGRDSPVLFKNHLRTPVSRFCLKTFVLPSLSWAIPEVGAFIKKAS